MTLAAAQEPPPPPLSLSAPATTLGASLKVIETELVELNKSNLV